MRKPGLMILYACTAALLAGAEGKWTPEQVLRHDPAWLKSQGLQLSPNRLWDERRKTGLLAAAVNIGGCSASFVSETGLVLTNHHCAFSLLQEHSTPSNDIITNGFLAGSKAEELPGKTTRITIPRTFTDVTREVLAAVPAAAGDIQRFRAIERKQKQLEAECEKQPASRCKVAVFDSGHQYVLVESMEIQDVRLVYAPPRAIGEFGGEVDNWMWPRHAGDFAIVRAYVSPAGKPAPFEEANVPYRPEFFFPISTAGVSPGEFVMVLGYPGITYRSLTAAEMAERRDLFFPRREEVFGEWIRVLEESTKGSAEGSIAVSAALKRFLNIHKNAQGQLAGFRRGNLLEKQRQAEESVAAWAAARPEHRKALDARREINELVMRQRETWERDFLLALVPNGPRALDFATKLVRLAAERKKPDLERETTYMNRNLSRLRDQLEKDQNAYYPPADKGMLVSFVKRAMALPAAQRITAIDRVFGAAADEQTIRSRVEQIYAASRVPDPAERARMFTETEQQLRARRDPLLDFAFQLDQDLQALKEREDRHKGALYRLHPLWRQAVLAHAGKPVAPDANGTLRVSFAHVKGYQPRDGVRYLPQTGLAGVIEKHTGVEPFNAPAALLQAAAARKSGPWQDAGLKDVPVNFLADADTTGGNSGSPTVNGKGELVGLNFDRVWENVANDFGYNPSIARNVNVDIRFMLWLLDQVNDAGGLLRELGVRK